MSEKIAFPLPLALKVRFAAVCRELQTTQSELCLALVGDAVDNVGRLTDVLARHRVPGE